MVTEKRACERERDVEAALTRRQGYTDAAPTRQRCGTPAVGAPLLRAMNAPDARRAGYVVPDSSFR